MHIGLLAFFTAFFLAGLICVFVDFDIDSQNTLIPSVLFVIAFTLFLLSCFCKKTVVIDV